MSSSKPGDSDSKSENAASGCEESIASQPSKSLREDKTDRSTLDLQFAQASSTEAEIVPRQRSASRSSSTNDDPKSLIDSISAASVRNNWCGKDLIDDDPSISSIKGDSVSATIADYNRKHRTKVTCDSQQWKSNARLSSDASAKADNSSVNINFYATGESTSGVANPSLGSKPGDFVSVSSNTNVDAFDVIEESSRISSGDELANVGSSSRRHLRRYNRRQDRTRSSSLEQVLDIDDLPQESSVYQIEPIIIRGNGNLTLFGLSNSFNSEFPSSLIGRVSKEEFDTTMRSINNLLKVHQSLSAKLLLFGGMFCCCSLGFSLIWPSIALKRRSKSSLEKLLTNENNRLYSKLGLNWVLSEQRCYSNHAFIEYVLKIEFTPKINIYLPD